MKPRRRTRAEDITPAWLEEKRAYAAYLVENFGEVYLPVFERLHQECEARSKRASSLDLVRQFARKAA
jgi:hypothetical protein